MWCLEVTLNNHLIYRSHDINKLDTLPLCLQLSPEYRKVNPGMFNLLFGAYGLLMGLSLCVINGASLFTSNIAYMMCSLMQKKSNILQMLYILILSWFTNLAGAGCSVNVDSSLY